MRGCVVIAASIACFVAGGCAYVSPLVGTVQPPRSKAGAMPLLEAAVRDVDRSISEMGTKRDQTVATARFLDLLTFGLASGAAYGIIPSGHEQAIRNLTFAAGASYVGSTLFAPLDIATIYNNGVTALACVANRGETLAGAVARYQVQTTDARNRGAPESIATAQDCEPDSTDLANALSAQDKVERLLTHVKGADAEQATRVREAGVAVIAAVNKEVLKRSNTPDAIFAAARALTPGSSGVVEGKSFSVAQGREKKKKPCPAMLNQDIRSFTAGFAEADKALTAAFNVMATLDTSCVLEQVSTVALTLSQENVTVTKDSSVQVLISGGRQPYSVTAVGSPQNVSVQLIVPSTIVVTGLSTIKGAGGPYDFQIKDNSPISTPKILKVSTK